MKATIEEITKATKQFAEVRSELSSLVESTNRRMNMIYEENVREIKKLLTKAAERRSELEAKIAGAPDLFEKPRTLVIHGIKIGMCKGKGKITWEDEAQVIKAIKKLFPDQEGLLIKTTEKIVKKALAGLPAADLRRLGVEVVETGDGVVIDPVDSQVDKMVEAMFKTKTEELEDAA